jgi:hypothetical protein
MCSEEFGLHEDLAMNFGVGVGQARWSHRPFQPLLCPIPAEFWPVCGAGILVLQSWVLLN